MKPESDRIGDAGSIEARSFEGIARMGLEVNASSDKIGDAESIELHSFGGVARSGPN